MRSVYVSGVGTRGGQSMQLMYRSFDGDDHWVGPTAVASGVAPSVFDPQLGRPVMHGIAGARVDLAARPRTRSS